MLIVIDVCLGPSKKDGFGGEYTEIRELKLIALTLPRTVKLSAAIRTHSINLSLTRLKG